MWRLTLWLRARLNNLLLGKTSTCPRILAESISDRQQHSISWVSHDPRSMYDTLNNPLRFGLIAGTSKSTTTDGPDDIASLSRSDPGGPLRAQQVDSIRRLLSTYNSQVAVWTYFRQRSETIRSQGAWGRAAVSSISRLLVLAAEHGPTRYLSTQLKDSESPESHCLQVLR
jgi:hypothetical protein